MRENTRVKNERNKHYDDIELHNQLKQYDKWLLEVGENQINYCQTIDCYNVMKIFKIMWRKSKDGVIESVYDDFDYNFKKPDHLKSAYS